MKKFFKRTGIGLLCVFLTLTLICAGNLLNNLTIDNTEYMVVSDRLPKAFDGYRIACLSDFHNSIYYNQAAAKVREMSPDVIFLTGDMINMNEETYDNTKKLLEGLLQIAPVYMVSGNHEMYHPKWRTEIRPVFELMGVKVLDIEGTRLIRGSSTIHVYGMQDPSVDDDALLTTQWLSGWESRAEKAADSAAFNILLCHRANYFERTSQLGYDLILSGHLHGGVARLPVVGGVFSPAGDRADFPEYTMGRYENEQTGATMISNRGMDFNWKRMRIFNSPEIVSILLKAR